MKFKIVIIVSVMFMFGILGTAEPKGDTLPGEKTAAVQSSTAIGIVANLDTNCIQLIDPSTKTISPAYLKGELGSYSGGLLGAAVSPDGTLAVVGNFGDMKLFFIDISGGPGVEPVLLGSLHIGIPPEDIIFTPNGQYILVTDAVFSDKIALVDVDTFSLKILYDTKLFEPESAGGHSGKTGAARDNLHFVWGCDANSVAVTPDGQTVITSDFFGGTVNTFTFDYDTGYFTQLGNFLIDSGLWPVNLEISPDGRTLIVNDAYFPKVGVFSISASTPGLLYNMGDVSMPTRGSQTTVFSLDGTKAYVLSNPDWQDTQVHIMDVTGPGRVAYSGTSIIVTPRRSSSGFYGVNTMALTPCGNYLYVSNTSDSGGVNEISVLDLTTNTQIKTLPGVGIPAGIAFGLQ